VTPSLSEHPTARHAQRGQKPRRWHEKATALLHGPLGLELFDEAAPVLLHSAGRHQAPLAGSFLANDLLTIQLSLLANLTDPSALLIPTVEYPITQSVLARSSAYPAPRPPTDPRAYDDPTVDEVANGTEPYRAVSLSRGLCSEYGNSSFGAFIQLGFSVP
jgi:hypothetical protein